jgi:hypothetical protein
MLNALSVLRRTGYLVEPAEQGRVGTLPLMSHSFIISALSQL